MSDAPHGPRARGPRPPSMLVARRAPARAGGALAIAAVILASGCVGAAPPAAMAKGDAIAESLETKGIAFIEDDIDGAMTKAKAEGKALFVDVWAPWCHTCLSMKNYVLSDPSLRGLAERVVFASIDSDRESSARFLERHAVNVWPMFFLIDPAADRVVGAWPGSASL